MQVEKTINKWVKACIRTTCMTIDAKKADKRDSYLLYNSVIVYNCGMV